MANGVLNAKELAKELGTDARTARKFLREVVPSEDQPGQGGRWTFTQKEVKKFKKRYEEWNGVKAKRTAPVKTTEVDELDDDAEEIEFDDDDFEDIEEI